VWTQDQDAPSTASRSTGVGRAVVGAAEEVLCWDVKKGELLSRWRDSACRAEVTAISRSKADPDVYAVGYALRSPREGNMTNQL
jgi:U3 small nucleolar RNA-associated protein 12